MRRRRFLRHLFVGLVFGTVVPVSGTSRSQEPLFLGVTTSTENSGLLAHLIDAFKAAYDIEIRAVTAGSGAVLNLAARGDVDVVLVHSPEDEGAFLDSGYGVDRRPVMRNRFVIVGPSADPASIGDSTDVEAAFAAIAANRSLFLSRGDDSGTHKAERRIWLAAGLDPGGDERDNGWYRESGSGQGATLNIAANTGAYTLTDEATWATFGNPGSLEMLFTGDEVTPEALLEGDEVIPEAILDNVYSIIRVNPKHHPGLNAEDALVFSDWLTSKAGQEVISSFTVGGRSLFQPIVRLAG